MGWVTTGDYEVALDDGKVVCRNAAGRRLKSVPAKLADDPAVVGLRQLAEWLERHERQCLTDVEQWMVRSLPVPLAVLTRVWPDPAWRSALRDLVVTGADGEVAGFLRDADPERGLGLVDLDGDTVRIAPDLVRLPHPVLLEERLATAGELLAELHAAAADRARDPFGRLLPADTGRFARAWLAAAVYTGELDRVLCAAAWGADLTDTTAPVPSALRQAP
nr:DUF4132 domain-containing protein [Streptomyces pactum]